MLEDKMEDHIESKHKDVSFKCSICSADLKYKRDFDRHMKSHTDTANVVCHRCNEIFSRKDQLDLHIKSKHEQILFE